MVFIKHPHTEATFIVSLAQTEKDTSKASSKMVR